MRKHDNIITESLFNEYSDLEPIARGSIEGFNLIQKIFDEKYRQKFTKIKKLLKATIFDEVIGIETYLWFSCELIALEESFLSNGLFAHLVKPNREIINERIQESDNSPIAKIKPIPNYLQKTHIKNAPRSGYKFIELIAEHLAACDIDFDDDVYKPYNDTKKQISRELRRSPTLHNIYIERGQILRPEKGSGKPKIKKNYEKKPKSKK